MRVSMIRIPAMVAFQHGGGGVAAFLISFVELSHRPAGVTGLGEISGLIGLTVGAATFSASLIAGGKLANKIRQTPRILPAHGVLLTVNILAILVTGVLGVGWGDTGIRYDLLFLILLSVSLGIVFSMRIGGADMPVLISFLNATAGLAAAFCGIAIENRLLIACGATVAASGSILTHVMCKAMNRSVLKVFLLSAIRFPSPAAAPPVREASCAPPAVDMPPSSDADPGGNVDRVLAALKSAKKVVMVPGYGMAIAQAQFEVVALAKKLIGMGKDVKFAIHPVAGRMPGHMNVLLAEADVDYEMLREMDEVNPEFRETDLALVIGACDVVNSAAIHVPGTPISGMPILLVHEARNVVVFNLDERPGYSGVENPLYRSGNTIMMLGDPKKTLRPILEEAT